MPMAMDAGKASTGPAGGQGAKPLRVLELDCYQFLYGARAQTDRYWTSPKKRGNPLLGPVNFVKVMRRLWRGEYDLVVVDAQNFSPFNPRSFLVAIRDWRLRALSALFATFAGRFMHGFHSVPVAAIDIRDTFGILPNNFWLLDRCHSYFKRELPADRWQVFYRSGHWGLPGDRWRGGTRAQRRLAKLKPLSLGFSGHTIGQPAEKTADVFFAGHVWPSSTVRSEGIKELRALRDEGFVIDIPDGKIPQGEFEHRLASAWLAWSPAGYGWDCYRHCEAPAMFTVPLMNYPTLTRHQPLVEGEHCLHYSVEPGGLSVAVRAALRDRDRLADIAAKGRAHVMAHHTYAARADHVAVCVLGRHLDGTPAGQAEVASRTGTA